MYCPRLDHFARLNADGTVGKCGHMIGAPGFDSWQSMQSSRWLQQIRDTMSLDQWPQECQRCQQTEQTTNTSIRLNSIQRDISLSQHRHDYVILGGVLDNICNSACQSCNSAHSTKIGSLGSKDYARVDNSMLFDQVPWDRIIELDLNGGEPTASPAYQSLLENLPPHVLIIRVNTNGSRVLPNIEKILKKNIRVIVTLSLDGTGPVHDYVRWPILWTNYQHTVAQYQWLRSQYTNLVLEAWTVVHSLNASAMPDIFKFIDREQLAHSWAYLAQPNALNPMLTNTMTLAAKQKLNEDRDSRSQQVAQLLATLTNNQFDLDQYIIKQDQLRNINIQDYLCA